MGFWDHVNSELKKAVEESWTVVKESARIGKLRLKIHNLHRDAERHFKEIGGIVYESAKTEALEEEIKKLKHKEASQSKG